jgi:hypothetical protein
VFIRTRTHAQVLWPKWFIRSIEGEARKFLLRNCITFGFILQKLMEGINFQTLLVTLAHMEIKGTFLAKSIWKTLEAFKTKLCWKSDSLRIGLSLNEQFIWWSLVLLFNGKTFAENAWFST